MSRVICILLLPGERRPLGDIRVHDGPGLRVDHAEAHARRPVWPHRHNVGSHRQRHRRARDQRGWLALSHSRPILLPGQMGKTLLRSHSLVLRRLNCYHHPEDGARGSPEAGRLNAKPATTPNGALTNGPPVATNPYGPTVLTLSS